MMRPILPPLRHGLVPLLACLILFLLHLTAAATTPAPAPSAEELDSGEYDLWLDGGPAGSRVVPDPLGPFNYVREFDQMVGFFAEWQVSEPGANYGGMIEAEDGPLGGVIQTDNTLEAVWCWSRYRQFSGRDTYDENVAAAWVYCLNYPAWLEEGAPGDDYYRVHNCAWGLTAVLQYEAATGDSSYTWYAEIAGTSYQQRLNAFCKGWAAGNLYLYGEARDDAALRTAADRQGDDVLAWLNTYPLIYLGYEYWAMSSGTALWGVCNSSFREDPAAGQAWLAINADYMDVWQGWFNAPGYDWDSAWNVAYCNAHFAVWDATGDPDYWQNGKYVADNLLSYDTDDDGGIVADSTDPVTEDMSWVSCYLVKFGVDRLMGDPPDHDAGALRFAGFEDGQQFGWGEPVAIDVFITNFGLSDETGVDVHLECAAGDTAWTIDLPFAALDTLTFRTSWVPPTEGFYTFVAWTEMTGDQNASNDLAHAVIQVGQPSGVPGGDATASLDRPTSNPFVHETTFRFTLARTGRARFTVYDVAGRRVATLVDGVLPGGGHEFTWDGRDDAGRSLSSGVYLYRLEADGRSLGGKLVRLR
jgi:hypothetical protein